MEKLARSFGLVRQSYRLLLQDAELMLLPLLSGIVMSVVVASFFFGIGPEAMAGEEAGAALYLPAFALYVVLYAVGIFFQCAVVAGATERLRGGDPTVASALGAAWRRVGSILLWSLLAATIGMALRTVQERMGFLGKLVVGLVGAAWSIATFFVVPVLVLEEAYIGDVVGRSLAVVREVWGEALVGGVGIGLAAFCAWGTLVMVTLGLTSVIGIQALLVLVFLGILLAIFFSALEGVYLASLYSYATSGMVPPGFDQETLRQAFARKDR